MGFRLTVGGPLLEEPFAPPFSSRSFVVPTAWHRQPELKSVHRQDLVWDLPLLKLALRSAYAGWETAEQNGWNWDAFFRDWQLSLSGKAANLYPSEALGPWRSLQAVQLDNHTGPALPSLAWQVHSRVAYTHEGLLLPARRLRNSHGKEFALRAEDPAGQPRPAWAAGARGLCRVFALAYPSCLGEVVSVFCGRWRNLVSLNEGLPESTTEKILRLSGQRQDVACYRELSPGFGYLRIPTFTPSNAESLEHYQEWIPRSAWSLTALVVDLRCNRGGMGVSALPVLRDLSACPVPVRIAARKKDSSIARALAWGYAQSRLKDVRKLSPSHRALFQHVLDTTEGGGISEPRMVEVTTQWEDQSGQQESPRHQPLVMALVDNQCASDGELLAYLLSLAPRAVLVGSNTGGVGQFTQPGLLILPYSRLPFRVASARSLLFGNAGSFEGYGLAPDILLPNTATWDAQALVRLAQSLTRTPDRLRKARASRTSPKRPPV